MMTVRKLIPRFLLAAGVAMAMTLLPACQSPRSGSTLASFPVPGPEWKTQVGQLRYSTPKRAVIGDVVVSRYGTYDFQLDFVAGPGVPLMSLRESRDAAVAEGLFARGKWSGTPEKAGRLGSWMALREVFGELTMSDKIVRISKLPRKSGSIEVPPVADRPLNWRLWSEHTKEGRRVTVEYPKTKERFVFVFTR